MIAAEMPKFKVMITAAVAVLHELWTTHGDKAKFTLTGALKKIWTDYYALSEWMHTPVELWLQKMIKARKEHKASVNWHKEMVRVPDIGTVKAKNMQQRERKHMAVLFFLKVMWWKGPVDVLKWLIKDFGVDVNSMTSQGTTFLSKSITQHNVAAFTLLMKRGAKVNPVKKVGAVEDDREQGRLSTSIYYAVATKSERCVDPETGDPVDMACYFVDELLRAGAEADIGHDRKGHDLLACAVISGNIGVVKLLVEDRRSKGRTIDMNHMYENNQTLLQLVNRGGPAGPHTRCKPCLSESAKSVCYEVHCNPGILRYLIDNGANPLLSGSWPRIAHSYARTKLEMCDETAQDVTKDLYLRTVCFRVSVIWCIRGFVKAFLDGQHVEGDILKDICTFAGIGLTKVADLATPWIPSQFERSSAFGHTWGFYKKVDRHIMTIKEARHKSDADVGQKRYRAFVQHGAKHCDTSKKRGVICLDTSEEEESEGMEEESDGMKEESEGMEEESEGMEEESDGMEEEPEKAVGKKAVGKKAVGKKAVAKKAAGRKAVGRKAVGRKAARVEESDEESEGEEEEDEDGEDDADEEEDEDGDEDGDEDEEEEKQSGEEGEEKSEGEEEEKSGDEEEEKSGDEEEEKSGDEEDEKSGEEEDVEEKSGEEDGGDDSDEDDKDWTVPTVRDPSKGPSVGSAFPKKGRK